jgi:bHLH factor
MADTAGYPTDGKLDAHNVHTNNKRKRDTRDQGLNRPAPHTANNDLTDQATASFLAAHNAADDDMQQQFDVHHNGGTNTASVGDTAAAALAYHQMTVPQATELQFQTQNSGDGSFSMGDHNQQQTGMQDFSLEALKAATQTGRPGQTAPSDSPPQSATHKPQVGTEEWHKVRRDNHKEGRHLYTCLKQQSTYRHAVERRRRETINEGINELAKIVPGCEKNKGSILQRAVQFITQLKENEQQNIEKWTLEKLLTEQAITELSASCDKFKAECQRAWDECQIYKRACENNGILPDEIKERQENGEQTGANPM